MVPRGHPTRDHALVLACAQPRPLSCLHELRTLRGARSCSCEVLLVVDAGILTQAFTQCYATTTHAQVVPEVAFFMLDTDCNEPDGNTATSMQATWLKGALNASSSPFRVRACAALYAAPPFAALAGRSTHRPH